MYFQIFSVKIQKNLKSWATEKQFLSYILLLVICVYFRNSLNNVWDI